MLLIEYEDIFTLTVNIECFIFEIKKNSPLKEKILPRVMSK